MDHLNYLLKLNPFNYDYKLRENIFIEALNKSFIHHNKNCKKYKMWVKKFNYSKSNNIDDLKAFPFIPSSIFKKMDLVSTKKYDKKILSSGTSTNVKSKIFLDKENSKNQSIVLSKIMKEIIGEKRIPFLIVDTNPSENDNKSEISARIAGLSGYLMSSSEQHFLLDKNLNLDIKYFKKLVDRYKKNKKEIIIIGYTSIIFQKLLKNKMNIKFPKKTKLIHFGGWKKLKNIAITKKKLNSKIKRYLGIQIDNIYDIYGFSEQLGTIYPSRGNRGCRVPAYSEIIVRDTNSLEVLPNGKIGFLQFISPLPTSYPGISILNDDLGRILKKEKNYTEFEVVGRLEESEERGCGDTLPQDYYI